MIRQTKAVTLAILLAAASPAAAQAPVAGDTQARTLFNVGAQAYEAGNFAAAIQAFEAAHKLTPRPGIVFSIAQAHKKQYYVSKNTESLRRAIQHYRDYLARVAQGGRRSDAAEALVELEPIAAGLGGAAGSTGPAASAVTRLMASSPTAGALVSLDGAKPVEAPLIAEVKPGKHNLRVTAPGYFEEARDVDVAAGTVAALDLPLREKQGRLTVKTRPRAQVSIDGRFVATTPLSQPIDVEPGRHLVTVTKNGYKAFYQELEVGRDEAKEVAAPLEGSRQRTVSYVLAGVGAGGLVAGGVLVGLAMWEQRVAADFDGKRTSGEVSCRDDCAVVVAQGYTDHVKARDDLRRYAAVVGGIGALVAGTGIVLFVFDQPTLNAMPSRRDELNKPPAPARDRPMEMSWAPLLGPGLFGASVGGTF